MPLNILIVEDEPLIALDLQTIIEDAEHHLVGIADTMGRALALATGANVDVAIMDIELATMPDGIETARRLREEHGVRSLFVSANIEVGTRAAAAVLDPVGFIDKPFVARQILGALDPVHEELYPALERQ
ncbi:response regulator [Aureimonas sp. AU22]|uniref:response regulator n=1 Tax=Aureimonas sp. AU22 TaxID=1638162 RepID=UPI000B192E4B|nr:response regulator [Aureimonas sp. AU22]